MNERLKELMIEAGKSISGDKHIDADFCQKFAQLIIQECASVVERDMDRAKPIWCSDKILKHFEMI